VQARLEAEEVLNPESYIAHLTSFDFARILNAEFFIWILVPCFATLYLFGFCVFYTIKDSEWRQIVEIKNLQLRIFAVKYMNICKLSNSRLDLTKSTAVEQLEEMIEAVFKENKRNPIFDRLKGIITEKNYMAQLELHKCLPDNCKVKDLLIGLAACKEVMKEPLIPMFPSYDELKQKGCLNKIWHVVDVCIEKVRIESRIWNNLHIHLDWSRPSLRFNYNACTFFFCCFLAGTSLTFDNQDTTLHAANASMNINIYDKFWSFAFSSFLAIFFKIFDKMTKDAIFIRPSRVKLLERLRFGITWFFIVCSLVAIIARASDVMQDLLSEWLYNSAINVLIAFTISDFVITLLISFVCDCFPTIKKVILRQRSRVQAESEQSMEESYQSDISLMR
jgi:hypothetical protein